MRLASQVMLAISLLLCTIPAFAIRVSVLSTNKDIFALGFKVNGEQHGGMGTEYQSSDVPAGTYTFGVRWQGQDIRCSDKSGKSQINLTHDARVVLNFKGTKCTFMIGAR